MEVRKEPINRIYINVSLRYVVPFTFRSFGHNSKGNTNKQIAPITNAKSINAITHLAWKINCFNKISIIIKEHFCKDILFARQ